MAALTDAMKWYNLGADKAPRLKYHFQVAFYSSKIPEARKIFDCVKSIELPKYSIDTEVVNAWNVRQLIPTKVSFEPISIAFHDTHDNRFQDFLTNYLGQMSGSFRPISGGMRTSFDGYGLKLQEKDTLIDKIEITRFYGADEDRVLLGTESIATLWKPKIIDVQHDTLDYSASEAISWQISVRFESVTYETIGGGGASSADTAPTVYGSSSNPEVMKAVKDATNNRLTPKSAAPTSNSNLSKSPLISGGGIGGGFGR
jgi:hypothetical protein